MIVVCLSHGMCTSENTTEYYVSAPFTIIISSRTLPRTITAEMSKTTASEAQHAQSEYGAGSSEPSFFPFSKFSCFVLCACTVCLFVSQLSYVTHAYFVLLLSSSSCIFPPTIHATLRLAGVHSWMIYILERR